MLTDIGEYIIGAHLEVVEKCNFVSYNVRPPGGGMQGLAELDVIGLNFHTKTAFLVEVTTHIRGLLYGNNENTINRIREKFERQKQYAEEHLKHFRNHHYMFWSPYVPVGYLTEHLSEIDDLELIINGEYKKRVDELKKIATECAHATNNPFFRMLQIMEHMNER
ncbi:hypothetical protein [Candidatus Spongiihabitans sp.]|uniref:hypothetical protein n=1 Tax=Candidatus Spongiihabitans sp. TaxID=3101308 RepID=UPI003C7A3BD3